MPKSKFYAFFQTEESFVKAVLQYLSQHPEILRAHDEELRHFTRVWMQDHMSMALGRMGFREKRFRTLDETLTQVIRELFERELKQYAGKFYVPAEERYA